MQQTEIKITTTAIKRDKAESSDIEDVISWMMKLNRVPSAIGRKLGLHAGTDVTGFSLMGHGWEMAEASKVGLKFFYDQLPYLKGAKGYANSWFFAGGAIDNHEYYSKHVVFHGNMSDAERMLLFDPQTSGGLLLGVPEDKLESFISLNKQEGQDVWVIGEVTGTGIIEVERP
jgi:selenide,water dikinase